MMERGETLMKKLISIMLAIATVFCSFGVHTIADETTKDVQSEQHQVIRSYWDAVDRGNWAEWVEYFAPNVRELYKQIAVNPEYAEGKIGITAVSSAEVLEISLLSNEYASFYFKELHQYYEQENAVACYKVVLNLVADESSDYFETGKCERIMILVKEDGHWYAGASYPFPQEDSELKSVHGYGFANYIPEPKTIKTRDYDGNYATMKFDDFVFLGVCNEVGNYNYKTQAFYANVIAVKMLGWWAVSIKYRENLGCDVIWGDVNIRANNLASEAGQKVIRAAVNAMDGIRICCIKNGKEKLFNCDINGLEPLIGYQSSGRFWQETSNYLAKNKGYNWKQIMEYFFNNSNYNGANIDKITVKHEGGHSYGSYSTNETHHWRTCSKCFNVSKGTHVWVEGTAYSTCKTCKYIKLNVQRAVPVLQPADIG